MLDKTKMTFGSLFAGIGGFDLGLERAGMTCKWQVEIDPFCQKVLAKHWPNVRRYEDVREVGDHNLETVDLICGGFPCQPHSVAGKRKGAADDRDLWPEYRRIITELRPTWVLGENVPGIRTTILDQVLFDLETLNYTTSAFSIPACGFNAPHRRYRIFIVAYAPQLFSDGGNNYEKQPAPGTEPELGDSGSEKRPIGDWWAVEPGVGRVVDGVPHRVDRLRALGNAVVPQVAEWIGRQIVDVEELDADA